MNKLKNAASSVKKFAVNHKVAIVATGTAVATAAVTLALTNSTVQAHVDFLKENDLLDKFNLWETETA